MYEIIFIFMGEHGRKQSESFLSNTLYLPYPTSPLRYSWPVKGCDVRLIDTSFSSHSFIKFAVLCLFGHGADVVHYYGQNNKILTFEKGFEHE